MTQRHLCHHVFTLSGHSASQRALCLRPPGLVVHSDHYPRDWPLWGLLFVSRTGPLGVLSWAQEWPVHAEFGVSLDVGPRSP